jgi:AraC-like DNA-binding protein
MQHAIDLILDEKLSIEKISDMLGFSSASYFSTMFKQKYGCSPKQYKKQKSDN